jgi:hypothetical protein
MHCVRSERVIAITLVVRRLGRQSACAKPSLQAGYRISAGCVRLALSTLFVFLFTYNVKNFVFSNTELSSTLGAIKVSYHTTLNFHVFLYVTLLCQISEHESFKSCKMKVYVACCTTEIFHFSVHSETNIVDRAKRTHIADRGNQLIDNTASMLFAVAG